ncbi:HpcH/HpaI aldolase/citrate lyase family protein [Bradyrhizobium sp. WSM471]|uniref:HpcH/HpaI aldolase/citrate lyase family protein n=1 Tax=Bradyrhizobium sp. WSM471 TaxID=319017 RepID=UPI00024D1E46|nr:MULTISPECIES: CoA ester lyase [Bradyrhizobium]EHR01102.1 citrate lyase beta subunit [Bradyrhizobium sp. WSM471]UFW43163.1 CoA ester lyase [Bradyrhizobium canariense]
MSGLDVIAPLFVSANRPERFKEAAASGADAVILDLEDAVPPEAKREARRSLHLYLGLSNHSVLVRINEMGSPWHSDDVALVSSLPIDGVVLPKAEKGRPLLRLAADLRRRLPIIALIETARGLRDAFEIAAFPGINRLAFDSIDFFAELGCSHTREALLFARSSLVLASRLAAKVPPLDGVTTSVDDADLAREDARYARDLGFGGKLAIHARQIGPISAGFRPDEGEIAWAHKVLTAGEGAVAVDGTMVHTPVRNHARSILARAKTAPLR